MDDSFEKIQLEVVLNKEDSGYSAYIPMLPGCVSEGDTFEQALANIRQAAELYLEEMSDVIPADYDKQTVVASISLPVKTNHK